MFLSMVLNSKHKESTEDQQNKQQRKPSRNQFHEQMIQDNHSSNINPGKGILVRKGHHYGHFRDDLIADTLNQKLFVKRSSKCGMELV